MRLVNAGRLLACSLSLDPNASECARLFASAACCEIAQAAVSSDSLQVTKMAFWPLTPGGSLIFVL